jgi:hypothetical protein
MERTDNFIDWVSSKGASGETLLTERVPRNVPMRH